jgi:hypothetical protein
MSPSELVDEKLCLVVVAPHIVPVQEEEVQIHVEEEPNIRRVFPRTTLAVLRSDNVMRFLPAVDPAFISEFVNNSSGMDLALLPHAPLYSAPLHQNRSIQSLICNTQMQPILFEGLGSR